MPTEHVVSRRGAWIIVATLALAACDPASGGGSGGGGGTTGSGGSTTSTTSSTTSTSTTTTGSGGAAGCTTAADCPGQDTECAKRACSGGTCGQELLPLGSAVASQTTGDCQLIICDGAGEVIVVPNDADVSDDGNPCTVDICIAGAPSHPAAAQGTSCGAGLACDSQGACVGCLADADCGASTACVAHHCTAGTCVDDNTPSGTGDPGGQTAGDCQKLVCDGFGGTASAPDDTDADDGHPCTLDACSGGIASHTLVAVGTSCGAGLVCDAQGACVGCISNADCNDGNACTPNDACVSGACTHGPLKTTCAAPDDCHISVACSPSTGCPPPPPQSGYPLKPDGSACAFPGGSGLCFSGYCTAGCFVNGFVYPAQSYFLDSQICQSCDPNVSTTSLYTGSCHFNNIAGQCSGTGVCDLMGTDCTSGCADCSVQTCGSGSCTGLPYASGAACVDDGNPCTADQCNGVGGCLHMPVSDGTPCGAGKACMGGVCM